MNRTSRTVRLLSAAAAVAVTGVLFQSVASLSRPTAIEQLAAAKANAVNIASVTPTPGLQRPGGR